MNNSNKSTSLSALRYFTTVDPAVVNVVQLLRHRHSCVGVCTHDSLRARCSLFTFTKSASCFIADPCVIRYNRRSAEIWQPSRNKLSPTDLRKEKKKIRMRKMSFVCSLSVIQTCMWLYLWVFLHSGEIRTWTFECLTGTVPGPVKYIQ